VRIDLFDRLPTPYGLVRGGVAPDHQKIKAVTRALERIATSGKVHFFGHVTLGADVPIDAFLEAYDQVVLTTGAEEARRLGIPGEHLPGVHTATAFVGWYNGHPDHQDHAFDLSGDTAVVVGMGNVAVDVARVLLKDREALAATDLAGPALAQLRASHVQRVLMLGRRGPLEASFTPAELQELLDLEGVDVVVDPKAVDLDPAVVEAADKRVRRNIALLQEAAGRDCSARRCIQLRFWTSPVACHGEGHLASVELGVNRPEVRDGRVRPVDTGERWSLETRLLLQAVGYRSRPIAGVPFDARAGRIAHVDGRVAADGVVVPRLYVAGWAKRGPQGVIGTNRADAKATVERMLEDLPSLPDVDRPGLTPPMAVSWDEWKELDAHEVESGQAQGRVREKLLSVEEMIRRVRED
jgi:ferredoxin--NADP+ reductase